MKVGIYGDAHITRKMGSIQEQWNYSILRIFNKLYEDFEEQNVELAVCLGDLFDKAVLEAKSVKLVNEVLRIINHATFPTYILLGNHEMDSNNHNILEYLSEYENINTITELLPVENKFLFIPYSVKIEDVPPEYIKDMYVFTHHDIYGSQLAGGKIKASFGVDPNLLQSAKYVFNGHIHLSSILGNIHNVGSITKMQQGELILGNYPQYIILDTHESRINYFRIKNDFIAYLTVSPEEIKLLDLHYNESVKFILRIDYENDSKIEELKESISDERFLHVSFRKEISNNSIESSEVVKRSSLDIKQYFTEYVKKDESIPDSEKKSIIDTGISLLGV